MKVEADAVFWNFSDSRASIALDWGGAIVEGRGVVSIEGGKIAVGEDDDDDDEVGQVRQWILGR